jgi:small GTP-binding protein
MSFFKVLVIGEVACGKTSLVHRIVNNVFNPTYKATLGCEFGLKIMEVDGESLRIQLWDLAGQDRLGGISKLYCREAHGALAICDVTNPATVERAIEWKHQIDENVKQTDGSAIPIVLCVNKFDMVQDSPPSKAEYDALASKHQFAAVYFTSAKTDYNATEALTHLTREIMHFKPKVVTRPSLGSKLGQSPQVVKKGGCC